MTPEDVVRSWYEARSSGAHDDALELLAEHVVWHIPGRSPVGGDHRGREAIAAAFEAFRERTGETFRSQLLDLVSSPDSVVALVRNTAQRDGRSLDSRQALQFRIEGDKIAEIWIYIDDLYAVDAFWS